MNKKDQLASRSFRRRAVKPADKIARDFILVHDPKPLTGFDADPGVESRRSDRSPLHDVKQRRHLKADGPGATQTDKSRTMVPPGWWSQTGSNRRPPACKAGALPTELWPRRRSRNQTARAHPGSRPPFGRSPFLTRGMATRQARSGHPFRLDPRSQSFRRGSEKPSHEDRDVLRRPQTWWAWDDSNVRPHPYQGCALTTLATGPRAYALAPPRGRPFWGNRNRSGRAQARPRRKRSVDGGVPPERQDAFEDVLAACVLSDPIEIWRKPSL